jgi:hypothetical protein
LVRLPNGYHGAGSGTGVSPGRAQRTSAACPRPDCRPRLAFLDRVGPPEHVQQAPKRELGLALLRQQRVRAGLAGGSSHGQPVGLDLDGQSVEAVEEPGDLGHQLSRAGVPGRRYSGPKQRTGPPGLAARAPW